MSRNGKTVKFSEWFKRFPHQAVDPAWLEKHQAVQRDYDVEALRLKTGWKIVLKLVTGKSADQT